MRIEDIYQCVESDFSSVNTLIHDQLSSRVPLVEKIAEYIIASGGKRMRPLIALLISHALNNPNSDNTVKLAAIIEFLHTATLLHDDVVDTSDLRRGKATANANWGNAPSVLVGDFLYSRAFQMMVEIGDMQVMSVLANTTNEIAEGEVFQLMNAKNPNITEDQYFGVIQSKTAILFSAASECSACIANSDKDKIEAAKEYGLQVGLAFQLVDDILDYTGDAATMGKNVGDDLAEGKPTLPLIFAMKEGSEEQRNLIRAALRQGDIGKIDEIISIVRDTGAIDYTMRAAEECKNKAIAALESLGDSTYTQALKSLAELSISRNQ